VLSSQDEQTLLALYNNECIFFSDETE